MSAVVVPSRAERDAMDAIAMRRICEGDDHEGALAELYDRYAGVALGLADNAGDHRDLLINLRAGVPGFVGQFERVAEIVVEEPGIRQSARERFRFYREQGYALQDHRLQRL